ncbi:alpha/beta hydrolase family protein [Campylobacter coli]|uniref:hypothetical protein n=1 Tax=Campylobacter coli TaxID=195 RepID=UPI00374FDC0E
MYEKQAKYMKLYKYARMCWASYSTGLNEGMFGKEDKKWGLKNQTQNFAKRYTIKFHQPNTFSGFSATLFYDIQKDEYIVSFRGTEGIVSMDAFADIGLTFGKGDFQANALKQFF